MEYNPDKHHRRSIRLKGYDYSQEGMFYVTMCIQNREFLFGKIDNGEMILNDAGKMVEKWYYELENKFPDIKCGEFVVMPNHFHCIIINTGHMDNVGADLCVCPFNIKGKTNSNESVLGVEGESVLGVQSEHIGSLLHKIVQWFKTMSTNEYIRGVKTMGWKRFDGKLWQRNYWEHIIKDDQSFKNISKYITNNPKNWDADKLK